MIVVKVIVPLDAEAERCLLRSRPVSELSTFEHFASPAQNFHVCICFLRLLLRVRHMAGVQQRLTQTPNRHAVA
jgi:hypothetical protein